MKVAVFHLQNKKAKTDFVLKDEIINRLLQGILDLPHILPTRSSANQSQISTKSI